MTKCECEHHCHCHDAVEDCKCGNCVEGTCDCKEGCACGCHNAKEDCECGNCKTGDCHCDKHAASLKMRSEKVSDLFFFRAGINIYYYEVEIIIINDIFI